MKASFVALLLAQECHIHFLRHVTSRSRTKAVQLAVAPVCQLGLVVGLDGAPTGSSGAGHGNSLARNGDSPPAPIVARVQGILPTARVCRAISRSSRAVITSVRTGASRPVM